jgi:hypothetical protein
METYILFGTGVLLSTIGFLIVYVLNGIKAEISEIKGQLSKIEADLHGRISDIDRRNQNQNVEIERRLSHIEARCAVVHKEP